MKAASLTALAPYIIRGPFSAAKLSYNNTGMAVCRSKMPHGKNKQNFSISTAEEFIAAITRHIPEKSFQLVRYRGWYSNRMRGERRKQKSLRKKTERHTSNEIKIIDVSDYKPRRIPPPLWRERTWTFFRHTVDKGADVAYLLLAFSSLGRFVVNCRYGKAIHREQNE